MQHFPCSRNSVCSAKQLHEVLYTSGTAPHPTRVPVPHKEQNQSTISENLMHLFLQHIEPNKLDSVVLYVKFC